MKPMFFLMTSSICMNKSPQFLIVMSIIMMCWVSSLAYYSSTSLWFSLLFMLIMISGLMIIFIYMISIIPKSNSSYEWKKFLIITLPIASLLLAKSSNLIKKHQFIEEPNLIFENPWVSSSMIIFLLIILFGVISVSSALMHPIQMNEK